MSATVAIAHNDHIEQAIEEALGHLEFAEAVQGRLVAVKPNDSWASPRDTTAVTQPDTLRAVLRYLRRFSPRRLVVIGGSGAIPTPEVFEYSGMGRVLREESVELVDMNRQPFAEVSLGASDTPLVVNRFLLQVESLVSLAQLKVHQSTTVTLSLKNVALGFPAADHYGYPRMSTIHSNPPLGDFHRFIAAMAMSFPIHLALLAGHPAMVGYGPLGGRAVETGLVVASRDAVAADTVGARLLGFKVSAVQHLHEAAEMGVGEADLGKIQVRGLSIEKAFGLFTKQVYGAELRLDYP